jgi:amino acid transporter
MPLVLMIIGGLTALAAFSGNSHNWSPFLDSYRPLGIGFGALLIILGVVMWCWEDYLEHVETLVRAERKKAERETRPSRVDLDKDGRS